MFNILMTISEFSVMFNYNLAIMYMTRKFLNKIWMPLKGKNLNHEIGNCGFMSYVNPKRVLSKAWRLQVSKHLNILV